jgi:hypothetical protein
MRKLVIAFIATAALMACGSIGWAAHATSLNTMAAVSRQLGPVETIGCTRAGDCPLGYRAGEERLMAAGRVCLVGNLDMTETSIAKGPLVVGTLMKSDLMDGEAVRKLVQFGIALESRAAARQNS